MMMCHSDVVATVQAIRSCKGKPWWEVVTGIFGTPRKYYVDCGVVGMLGWAVYLLTADLGLVGAAFLGALTVAAVSSVLAVVRKCPTTVFLICGIIPLVPGGGIFWTAYYLVSDQLRLAATTGFTALKVTIAIAGGIILVGALAGRINRRMMNVNRRRDSQV
jgi:uncharacterized membrane protein YjjB (DUF3815 family)